MLMPLTPRQTILLQGHLKSLSFVQVGNCSIRILALLETLLTAESAGSYGRFEFSCVPRSILAADGSLLPCTDKSKLMGLLESLGTESLQENREVEQELQKDC